MAAAFSLTPAVRVFPCLNFGETINTSMQQCQFCSAPVDAASAEAAAEETSRVSAAVSDASYIRILCGAALTFLFLRFVLFLNLIGIFGFIFVEIAIPVMLIRWWIKYGSIKTADPDYGPARKRVLIVGGCTVLFFLLRSLRVITIKPS